MAAMTDPTDALVSFQAALLQGVIPVQPGAVDPNLYVHRDTPADGVLRLSYVKLDGKTVTAFVVYVWGEPVDGVPCLQIGYAVPPEFRNQGLAKAAIRSSLEELKVGLGRNGVEKFYVEAVVGADNDVSNSVAYQVLSETRNTITDEFSGCPAFQYLKLVECKNSGANKQS